MASTSSSSSSSPSSPSIQLDGDGFEKPFPFSLIPEGYIKPVVTLAAASAAETLMYPVDSLKTWSQVVKRGNQNSRMILKRGAGVGSMIDVPGFSRSPFSKNKQKFALSAVARTFKFYKGIAQRAYQRGGMRAFFHGCQFAIARNGLSTMCVLGFGTRINNDVKKLIPSPLISKVTSSLILSTCANGVLVPIETLKIRLQADGRKNKTRRRYTSSSAAARDYVRKHGLFALWTGSAPMLLRSTAWWVTAVPVYTSVKEGAIKLVGTENAGVHTLASVVSGITATVASHPFDVIRVKMANQSVATPKYSGMFHCFHSVLKKQGIPGLYRGFLPRYGRLGPWQLIFFVLYEQGLMLATGRSFSM